MNSNLAESTKLSTIAQIIDSNLWSPDPEIREIVRQLREQFGFADEEAGEMLYAIYKDLNKRLFTPITDIELMLTEACNLSCAYCFEQKIIGAKNMSAEIARRAVDFLFDYSFRRKKLRITFFGGEPTLNLPVIEAVLDYVTVKRRTTHKDVEFHMTSNGMLIDEGMARLLAERNVRVLVSIDGLKDTHDRFRVDRRGKGTFDIVIANAMTLKKYQPWIGTKMTVMPETVESLYDDVKGLADAGINHFIIGAASGGEWSAEALETLRQHLTRIKSLCRKRNRGRRTMRVPQLVARHPRNPVFGCQAARSCVCITTQGEISPCARVLALNGRELVAHLGNLSSGIFKLHTRREMVTCRKLRENCATLGLEKEFQGGCFATNFEESEDLFLPSLNQIRIHDAERLSRTP